MGIQEILAIIGVGGEAGLILGAVAILATIGAGLALKNKAVVGIGQKDKLVDGARLDAIDEKLGKIDQRLTSVEVDLTQRPSKEEMHKLEIAMTRLEGRMTTIETTGQATAAAISRIEDHMYEAALRMKT